MNPTFFLSGRRALNLALKDKTLTQLRNALPPKTLHRLAVSGDPQIEAASRDALFEQSTAEARAFQRLILASWLEHPDSLFIPDDIALKKYLPNLPESEQLLTLTLMAKRKGWSYDSLHYFNTKITINRCWIFPWMDAFDRDLLCATLSTRLSSLARRAKEHPELAGGWKKRNLGEIIDFLYFKEALYLLPQIIDALKEAPLLLVTCSAQHINILLTLISDDVKFAILEKLISFQLLTHFTLESYVQYCNSTRLDPKLLDSVLSLFLESLSIKKRTLFINEYKSLFLNNYLENGLCWKPYINQLLIAALPYLDDNSMKQCITDFLSYVKSGAEFSKEHGELGLSLMPYLDQPSLQLLAPYYLGPGILSREQRHAAWRFLSVRVLPQCINLINSWIQKTSFKVVLKDFLFGFNYPLPKEQSLTYLQQLHQNLMAQENAFPLNEAEAYARLLGVLATHLDDQSEKLVFKGLKKLLVSKNKAGLETFIPESRFIYDAFCNAVNPDTPLPTTILELFQTNHFEALESSTPFLILPEPFELLKTVPIQDRYAISNMLRKWDQHLRDYLEGKEIAENAIEPFRNWSLHSGTSRRHRNACQIGMKLINAYLFTCSLEQLHLMKKLIEKGLSSLWEPVVNIELNHLLWIATLSRDSDRIKPGSSCSVM